MFLIIAFGYYLFQKQVLTNNTTQTITVLLNKYVTPCFLLRSFQRPFDAHLFRSVLAVFVVGLALYLISIALVHYIYPASTPSCPDLRTSAVLTNNGFMGLPLLNAMFGADGVFFGSAHIAAMATALWTYGIRELSGGKERVGLRQVFFNPAMFGLFAGLILFCSPVKLPGLVYDAVDMVANINTPLAMLTLGCYMAQVDLKKCFAEKILWHVSAVRLLLIPAISLLCLLFLPLDYTCKLTLITGCSVPSALAAAMFGQIYHADYLLSTRAIVLNTMLSAVTLPLMVFLMDLLLRLAGQI